MKIDRILNLFLFVNCLNISTKTVSIKKIIFVDQNDKEHYFDIDFSTDDNGDDFYIFKIGYKKFTEIINSNIKFEDLKNLYSTEFKIDVSNFKKEDILKNFFLKRKSQHIEGWSKVYFKILPKIEFEIENEKIVDDKILEEIKEDLAIFIKNYVNYENFHNLNLKKFKDLNKNIFKITNLTKFKNINGDVHNENEDVSNLDCSLDSDCKFRIELDKSKKIYKTSVNYYLNNKLIDNYSIISDYNFTNFDYKCNSIRFNDKDRVYKVEENDNIKIKRYDIGEINILINNPEVVRYEIIQLNGNTNVFYCKKKKRNELIKLIMGEDNCRYTFNKDGNQINFKQELEEGKYKLEEGKYKYKIYNTDYYFYKKVTADELLNIHLKNFRIERKNQFIITENPRIIFNLTDILEPGNYSVLSFSYNGKEIDNINDVKKFAEISDDTIIEKDSKKSSCVCYKNKNCCY